MNTAFRGLIRGLAIAAVAGVLVFAGFGIVSWLEGGKQDGAGIGEVSIGGSFSLVDQNGRTVSDKDYRGKLQLVYFGFTSCPDICPTALQTVAIALDELGAAASEVAPILITVDPERDTPAAMKEYVQAFHERLIGLTGTPEQIAAVAKAYRVYFQKVKLANSSLDYSVDHSGFLYLMNRDGKYLAHFRHNATPEEIAKRVKSAL